MKRSLIYSTNNPEYPIYDVSLMSITYLISDACFGEFPVTEDAIALTEVWYDEEGNPITYANDYNFENIEYSQSYNTVVFNKRTYRLFYHGHELDEYLTSFENIGGNYVLKIDGVKYRDTINYFNQNYEYLYKYGGDYIDYLDPDSPNYYNPNQLIANR